MKANKLARVVTSAAFISLNATAVAQSSDEYVEYYESGQYMAEVQTIIDNAKSYLQQQTKTNKNLAVIFDIDDTCLSNYEILKASKFPQERETIIQAFKDKALTTPVTAIKPTLELYRYCQENQIATFFITGRYDDPRYMALTEKQLKDAGFNTWDGLYYHPSDNPSFSKVAQHEQVINQGYTIVLNLGDQDRDLVGDYAQKHVKLPNPFYTLE